MDRGQARDTLSFASELSQTSPLHRINLAQRRPLFRGAVCGSRQTQPPALLNMPPVASATGHAGRLRENIFFDCCIKQPYLLISMLKAAPCTSCLQGFRIGEILTWPDGNGGPNSPSIRSSFDLCTGVPSMARLIKQMTIRPASAQCELSLAPSVGARFPLLAK